MAFQFDVNGTIPGTGAACIFRLKTLLKAAGWAVKASGDGLSAFSSTGDIITSGGSGANGMANADAWFRIQQPSTNTREFTFQTGSGTSLGRWKYSGGPGTGFTGGSPSATVTPTATDGQIILGGGTDAAPTFAQFIDTPESTMRFNALAGDATSNYVFLWWTQASGVSTARNAMFLDVMLSNTFPVADADPAVVYVATLNAAGTLNSDLNAYVPQGWLKKNLAGAGYVTMSAAYYTSGPSHTAFPIGLGQNPHSGKDDFAPVVWMRGSDQTVPTGFKGVSTFLNWLSITRSYGDTYNVNTVKDFLAIGSTGGIYLAIPWNGTDLTI